MPFVKSRVNGLMVAIPNDARNVIHRFAVHGGGNELVFDPIKRSDYDKSKRTETQPLGLGSGPEQAPTEPVNTREDAVALTVGVAEDEDDEPEVAPVAETKPAKPARSRTRRASPSTDDDEITI